MQPIISIFEFNRMMKHTIDECSHNQLDFQKMLVSKISEQLLMLPYRHYQILHGENTEFLNAFLLVEKLKSDGFSVHSVFDFSHDRKHLRIDDPTTEAILDCLSMTTLSNSLHLIDIDNFIKLLPLPVVSIHFPWNLNAQTGQSHHLSHLSAYTLVLDTLCYAHVLGDGYDTCGEVFVVPLGLSKPSDLRTIDYFVKEDMTLTAIKRKHNSHKYHYGHVLVVGGSPSMMGSVALTSTAALRSGAGLVSLATYQPNLAFTRLLPYEVMTPTYTDVSSFERLLISKSSIAFGMGLSKEPLPVDIVACVLDSKIPTVIDADGLFHCKNQLFLPHNNTRIVLTPHAKEFERLVGKPLSELREDVLTWTQWLSEKTQSIVLLKGPSTIVSSKNKSIIIQSGHPGLAKAGSGDVLSGVIATYLAQTDDVFEATVSAVIHFSLASFQLLETRSMESILASDLVEQLLNLKEITK